MLYKIQMSLLFSLQYINMILVVLAIYKGKTCGKSYSEEPTVGIRHLKVQMKLAIG